MMVRTLVEKSARSNKKKGNDLEIIEEETKREPKVKMEKSYRDRCGKARGMKSEESADENRGEWNGWGRHRDGVKTSRPNYDIDARVPAKCFITK